MSEYLPKPEWHSAIREFDVNEIVEGGATGIDNIPHQQLADSIAYLLRRVVNIEETLSVIVPEVLPSDSPGVTDPDPSANPTGAWTVVNPPYDGHYWGWSGVISIDLVHSSGEKVSGVVLSTDQIRTSDNRSMGGHVVTAKDTDDQGRIRLNGVPRDRLDSSPNMVFTVTAPNTTTFSQKYYVWDGVPVSNSPGGGGGNANQTE